MSVTGWPRYFAEGNLVLDASSVAKDAGFGVYANRAFAAQTLLGFSYPGLVVSYHEYDAINHLLFTWAALADDQGHVCEAEEVVERVKLLEARHKIFLSRDSEAGASEEPNWGAIYDRFYSHSYDVSFRDQHKVVYWNCYDWNTGRVKQSPSFDPAACAGLFINEPPPYVKFYNTYAKREQQSGINVKTVWSKTNGRLEYWSTRKIQLHDELLVYYGSLYKRNYVTIVDAPLAMLPLPPGVTFKRQKLAVILDDLNAT